MESGYENCSCQLQQRAQSNARTLQDDIGTGPWKVAINPDKFDKLVGTKNCCG
ncbi:MAG: hypothetical protein ACJ72X_05585 [Nitrososphaeraceae archaeon]